MGHLCQGLLSFPAMPYALFNLISLLILLGMFIVSFTLLLRLVVKSSEGLFAATQKQALGPSALITTLQGGLYPLKITQAGNTIQSYKINLEIMFFLCRERLNWTVVLALPSPICHKNMTFNYTRRACHELAMQEPPFLTVSSLRIAKYRFQGFWKNGVLKHVRA